MDTSNIKDYNISDDLKDLEDLQIAQQDLTSKQLYSIMDAVSNLSLESTKGKSPKPLSQIDQLINAIKLLDEREEKAREKSATATEFDKIRREISRQRMDLIREGQALSFMDNINNKEFNPKPNPRQVMTTMTYRKRNLINSLSTLLVKRKRVIIIEPLGQQLLIEITYWN